METRPMLLEKARQWGHELELLVESRRTVADAVVFALLRAVVAVSVVVGFTMRWFGDGGPIQRGNVLLLAVPVTMVTLEVLFRLVPRGPWVWNVTAGTMAGLALVVGRVNGPVTLVIGGVIVPFLHVLLPSREALWSSLLVLVGLGAVTLTAPPPIDVALWTRAMGAGCLLLVISRLAMRHVLSINASAASLAREVRAEVDRLVAEVSALDREREAERRRDAASGLLSPEGLQAAFADQERAWPNLRALVLAIRLNAWEATVSALPRGAQLAALADFADRLRRVAGTGALIARLGRTEFAVVWRVEDEETLGRWGDIRELLGRLRGPVLSEGGAVLPAPLIGVARFPEDGASLEDCLRRAEIARVVAEQLGVDAPSRFDRAMERQLGERAQVTERLRGAIARGEFELRYQPIVPTRGGPVRKAEALVRWHDGDRGMISPGDFLPLIASAGLHASFTRWTFEQAVRDLKRFRVEIDPTFQVAVNIAPEVLASLGRDPLGDLGALEVLEAPRDGLVVEITESSFLALDETVRGLLALARRRGVRIALDDFGTGYSSLDRLQALPVDILKIDRAFVQRVDAGRRGASVLRAVLQLAIDLELDVVAEGVEHERQRAALEELGCPNIQGFLIAPSLPADQLVAFARRADTAVGRLG